MSSVPKFNPASHFSKRTLRVLAERGYRLVGYEPVRGPEGNLLGQEYLVQTPAGDLDAMDFDQVYRLTREQP